MKRLLIVTPLKMWWRYSIVQIAALHRVRRFLMHVSGVVSLYGAEFIGNNLTSTAYHYHYMNTDSSWNAQSMLRPFQAEVFCSHIGTLQESMTNADGEEVSTREIKKILEDTLSEEDKRKPLVPMGSLRLTTSPAFTFTLMRLL